MAIFKEDYASTVTYSGYIGAAYKPASGTILLAQAELKSASYTDVADAASALTVAGAAVAVAMLTF